MRGVVLVLGDGHISYHIVQLKEMIGKRGSMKIVKIEDLWGRGSFPGMFLYWSFIPNL